jgi:hypothetical protein
MHRCVPVVGWALVDDYLSPCSSRVPAEFDMLLSLEGAIWFPRRDSGCSLTIVGNCPHVEGCLSCKAPLFLRVRFSPLS